MPQGANTDLFNPCFPKSHSGVKLKAGHFRYFLIFSIIKMIYLHFYKVNNLFLHQSYLKSPLPVKLARKKCKKSFFINEKI